MNSSTVIKKTLPLIVALIVIIAIALIITAVKGSKKENPLPSGYEDVYVEAKEGEFTYSVDKKTIYDELKNSFGVSTAVTLMNKKILKSQKVDNVSFWDKVTDEEIAEALEEAIYPDGKEDLTEEEIAEAADKYNDTMYTSYGYTTAEEINEYHRLVLAKKKYAEYKLAEEIKAQDAKADKDASDNSIDEDEKEEYYFNEEEIDKYYTENYVESYWVVVLPFTSKAVMNNALAQLGIKIHEKDSTIANDYARWVKLDANGEELKVPDPTDSTKEILVTLTAQEVTKAYIDLYNMIYGYKNPNYPTEKDILVATKQYTVDENGNYVFNTKFSEEDEALNELYYTYTDLNALNSSVQNYVKSSMVAYVPVSDTEAGTTQSNTSSSQTKWYTPTSMSYSSVYYLMLKINETAEAKLEDVKSEIIEKLTEAEITDNYIETKMAELREEKNVIFYDADIEADYISSMETYKVEHKATKEASKDVICAIDVDGSTYEIKVDDFFKEMDSLYGPAIVLSEIVYERFLTNTDFNKYYDYANDKWLDKDIYKEKNDEIDNLRLNFIYGSYESYGYSPNTMTWEEFLQNVNGVKDEAELRLYYLYGDLIEEYTEKYNNIIEKDEETDKYVLDTESSLWKMYVTAMESIEKEFYSVEGVHLLICTYENEINYINETSPVDPKEWSEYQKALAQDLFNQINTYVENETGTIEEKLQAIEDGFRNAPRFVTSKDYAIDQQPVVKDLDYMFENIEVAKFKSAGLAVKFEDLETFANGSMTEAFDNAVKEIWDANPESDELIIYETAIETEFGYHFYCNTKTNPIAKWTDAPIFKLDEENTKILWKYVGSSEWEDLITLAEAEIELGKDQTVSFNVSDGTLQYKLVNTKDSSSSESWTNLVNLDEKGIKLDNEYVIPTLGLVRTYLANATDTNLTEGMKTAYTTYFQAIYDEVKGTNNMQIKFYTELKDFELTLKSASYTKEALYKTIDMSVKTNKESLKYVADLIDGLK